MVRATAGLLRTHAIGDSRIGAVWLHVTLGLVGHDAPGAIVATADAT